MPPQLLTEHRLELQVRIAGLCPYSEQQPRGLAFVRPLEGWAQAQLTSQPGHAAASLPSPAPHPSRAPSPCTPPPSQQRVIELVEKVLTLKGHVDARAHENYKYARDTLDDSLLQLVSCLQARHSKYAYQLLAKAADPAKAARGWRCAAGWWWCGGGGEG